MNKIKKLHSFLSVCLILSFVLGSFSSPVLAYVKEVANFKQIGIGTLSNNNGAILNKINPQSEGVRSLSVDSLITIKENLSESKKKLGTDLLKLIDSSFLLPTQNRSQVVSEMKELKQFIASGDSVATINKRIVNKTHNDLVYVYVNLQPTTPTSVIDSIAWNVTDRDEKNHLATALVETNRLETLASLKEVRSISSVLPPVTNSGSVATEGDVIQQTAAVRAAYSQGGSGIKIGVISDGVDNIASAKSTGDLPAGVTVLSNSIGGDEGTAMLEIIHDMTPDASLYFHDCGNNVLAFNSAVDDLVTAGANVIVDDIVWLGEPFFEDGTVASHVASVLISNNIIYVSAGGNYAKQHYQGDYYNNGSNYHDFSRGSNPTFKNLYANIPPGGSITVILQWNDNFGSSGNDYDLLMDNNDGSGLLAGSFAIQNNDDNPFETFSYTNTTGSAIDARIWVNNYNGSATIKTLELFIFPSNGAANYSDNITSVDSIFGQQAVSGVIAVGAIPASNPSTIESFSSQGPVTIIGQAQRMKPDIAGIDCVSVTGVGFHTPFCGTSAAAPAVAAIAAQLWGEHPSATGNQIRNRLLNSAVDLGTPGVDTVFGHGRADSLLNFQVGPTITAFNFTTPVATGVINESAKTIAVTVPFGTNVTALAPTITITGASTSPLSGVAQNFTNPVIYTATSSDGLTKPYTVTVNVASTIPTCSSGVLNGDGVSDTVQVVLTCDNTVKFASSGTTTANATDLDKIKLQPESDSHKPFAATISGNELTLTFNAEDGTFAQNIDIDAGTLASSSSTSNNAISLLSTVIVDHAKPKVFASAISTPKLANEAGGFEFGLSNTEGGALTYSGGCTTDNTTIGWTNLWTYLKWNGTTNFPEGVYDSCAIILTDPTGNFGTGIVPTFIVDLAGPVTGDVTVSPLYKVGLVNYISRLSSISAPVTDAGTGVDGTSCEYSLDGGNNVSRNSSSYIGGVCSFANIDTSGATGINVRAQYDNGNYHQGVLNPAKNVSVTIDITAPITTATATASGATYIFGALTNQDINVSLSCDDMEAGCDSIKYSTDGRTTWQNYVTPFIISDDNIKSVQFYSTDRVGNTESPVKTEIINLDQTAPNITLHGVSPMDLIVGGTFTDPGAVAIDNVDGEISDHIVIGGDTVNTSVVGTYVITYNVSDTAGNSADQVIRTVNVGADTTAPIITAPADINQEANGILSTVDLGTAIATDAVDPNPIIINDAPATFPLGTTVVTWTATDTSGNHASAIQNVVIVDTLLPVVVVNTPASPTKNPSITFTITDKTLITTECKVNDGEFVSCVSPFEPTLDSGTYTITVRATDAASNIGSDITDLFTVDTNSPTINVTGPAIISKDINSTFTFESPDGGSNFECKLDGNEFVPCSSPTSYTGLSEGPHEFVVRATDSVGNIGTKSYNFTIDLTSPIIALHEDISSTAVDASGAVVTYIAPNAIDNIDGTFSATCSPISGSTFILGTTTVNCDASDTAGNAATSTSFNILVEDKNSPIITILGNNPVNLTVGDSYTDTGATATDNVDGSVVVISSGLVDTVTIGVYTITYIAEDAAHNVATAIRTVNVNPVVTLSSIAVTHPANKLSYTVGDALNIIGLVVTGTYSDASTKIETITTGNITGFNSSTPVIGQVLTITVNGKTTTYTINIVDALVIGGGGGGGSYTPPTTTTTTTTTKPGTTTTTTTKPIGKVLGAVTGPVTIPTLPPNPTLADYQNLLAALIQQLAYLQSLEPTSGYKFNKNLQLGSSGEDVRQLQMFLKSQGTDIYPEGLITGYFGSLTKKAVERFQIKYGIANLGEAGYSLVGPKTRAKINSLQGL